MRLLGSPASPAGRLTAVLLGTLLGAGTAAGCAVPAEDRPREVTLPGRGSPSNAQTTPAPPQIGSAMESLCFVRDAHLERVERRVPAWPTVETQIQHLVAGPDKDETELGYTSPVKGMIQIVEIHLSRGEVTVVLGGDPQLGANPQPGGDADGVGRSDAVLAYGQIVCTLGQRPDVRGVSFRHQDGQPVFPPRGDGSRSDGPLTAIDYAELLS